MRWPSWLGGKPKEKREEKASSTDVAGWFFDWATNYSSTTGGVSVTPKSAMRLAAVWACVQVRSEDIGKLPCILYRRRADGGKDRAVDHPLYRIIHDFPNPRHTAFEFKQMMQINVDLYGNAFAMKDIDGRGRVSALWPIENCRVQVLVAGDGSLFYRLDGKVDQTFPAERFVHLRGNSLDGITGISPIQWQRETIGLALAAERYGAAFFGNSAQPQGALTVENPLSPEAAAALRAAWEKQHQGPENAHKLAIFDGGMKWEKIGADNTDAQFVESRTNQNQEIYRIFRMPPHKVGDLSKATFSNIEMQSIEYVQDCLMSAMVRWEQTLARDLLLPEEQGTYFFEFMPDALLKGDIKSRYDAYAVGLMNGWLSDNEIRDRENMNRIEDGDQYFRPGNLLPLDAPAPLPVQAPAGPAASPPAKGRRKANGKEKPNAAPDLPIN